MMNFSGKAVSSGEKKKPLNPNAAEFVPLALRSSSGAGIGNANASSKFAGTAATNGKKAALLDRSQSSTSNNSDDDIHQFWRHQLPDDITPDFKFMGVDDDQVANTLPLSSLSLTGFGDNNPSGEFSSLTEFNPSVGGKLRRNLQFFERGSRSYSETSGNNLAPEMSNERFFDEEVAAINPLEFLASQFPGFAVESLAQVYFLNGGDVNLTVEMLNQFEGDESVNQNLESNTLDFPALSGQNGLAATSDYLRLNAGPFRSSGKENAARFRSDSSRTATDFASVFRGMANQDAGIWNYDIKGSSRSSQILASSYHGGLGRSSPVDKFLTMGSTRESPVWLETREDARFRNNAYFEQAYLVGSKASDLNAAPREPIYLPRNDPEMRTIDLHGLHAIEALHVLKREIAATRNAARVGGGNRGLIVNICVETRGSRTTTPAVRRYLMEEEGLDFSELQPGLLRVVVY